MTNFFGRGIITGFARLNGFSFGVFANDSNFYSYIFTGGGANIRNFYNYFRTKFGYDIQFLEPPKSCGIPKVLNDGSIMSLYSSFWFLTNKSTEEGNFIQKIDSFSNKIWYKRFVDLL